MSEPYAVTWNDIAYHWDDWGPPLRPAAEDVRIMAEMLARRHAGRGPDPVDVFLCGVTPEIVTMAWPFPIRMLAVDRSASMVKVVWPGDVPGVRRAEVGNWLTPPADAGSQDVVIIDGGNALFDCPTGQRTILAAWHRLLRPGGLLVLRHFSRPDKPETPEAVIADARAGKIGNYHVFKWRMAVALQVDAASGVRLGDIWQACVGANVDSEGVPQPGWSESAVSTIRFYEKKDGRLYFPTLDEFEAVVAEQFECIEVIVPEYELGDRCPIVAARPR